MIYVDLTIVGFSEDASHIRLEVPGAHPTVKAVLEAMRSVGGGSGLFSFDEKRDAGRKGLFGLFPKEVNAVSSMTYGGYSLSGGKSESGRKEERTWRFSVLRRTGDRSVLMQNSRNLPYDQFRVEDGDQIFWSLVTVLSPQRSLCAENEFDQDVLMAA